MSYYQLHILSGLPGSGKSYWMRRFAGHRAAKLSRDEVRAKLREQMGSTDYFPVSKADEWDYWIRQIVNVLEYKEKCHEYYIDQTSLNPGAISKLLISIDEEFKLDGFDIIIHVFHTPIDVCKARNAQRSGMEQVPNQVIDKMRKIFNVTSDGLKEALADHPDLFRAIQIVHHPDSDTIM